MNEELLKNYIDDFLKYYKENPQKLHDHMEERNYLINYYQNFTKDKILQMTEGELYEYLSKLWAMSTWGNKQYIIDKIIEENGLRNFCKSLAALVWGDNNIIDRWNNFHTETKRVGPAMKSEILCKTHPNKYMLWNRRVFVGLNCLEVENLPIPGYGYQLTGKVYSYLCNISKNIADELKEAGFEDTTLLAVDYFIRYGLQVKGSLLKYIQKKKKTNRRKT